MPDIISNKLPTPKIRTVKFRDDLYQMTDAEIAALETKYGIKMPEFIKRTRVDVSENVRELHRYEQSELEPLIDSILEDKAAGGNGIKDEPSYMEDANGKLHPIQGHRRTVAAMIAGLESTRAKVYPTLERHQFMLLLLDHGQRQGLSQVEVFYSIEKGYEADLTQKQLAVELRPLLEQIQPLTDKQKERINNAPTEEAKKQNLLDCYRGRIQGHIRVCNLPLEVRDAWVAKQRGKQKWPTENEVRELESIFMDEKKKDPLVTKLNPGPKYQERWKKILTAVAEADANGTARPKSTGMKNRKEVDEYKKKTSSVFVRCSLDWLTNDLPEDRFAKVVEIMVAKEATLTPEELLTIKRAFDPAATAESEIPAPKEEAAEALPV
jgi:ParB-like chromosome segregation protein Spo0J